MGGRLSRTWSVIRREAPRKPEPLPSVPTAVSNTTPVAAPESSPLEHRDDNSIPVVVPEGGPLEHRDEALEQQLRQLGDIATTNAIFVPGSDPISAERKRKERREWRRQMLKHRLTTAQFKDILVENDAAKGGTIIEHMAEKYDVDAELLRLALGYYRFPKISKRYDGYLESDRWED